MRVFARTFARMLPEGCRAAACVIEEVDAHAALCGVENSDAKSFSAPRRRDFAAGRAAARMALGLLGYAHAPLPIGEGRAPVWPKGTAGSIAHSSGVALAAVGRSECVTALGIDIERCGALETTLATLIYAKGDDRVCDPTLVFSMKESAFKCVYSIHRRMIDFTEVVVWTDASKGRFRARPSNCATVDFPTVCGNYDRALGFWRTACYLHGGAGPAR